VSQPLTDEEIDEAVTALLQAWRELIQSERKADLMLAGKLICRDGLRGVDTPIGRPRP